MPDGGMGRRRRRSRVKHLTLHVHVNIDVDMGSFDVGMTQPSGDAGDIVACMDEMDGCGVTKGMGADGFFENRGGRYASDFGVFFDDVPDTEACDGMARSVEEEPLVI